MAPPVRPSALPRLEMCPASGALPSVAEASSDAADRGTDGHAMIAAAVAGAPSPAWVGEMIAEVSAGLSLVGAEVKLSYRGVTGTADLLLDRADHVAVVDWKTGRTQVYPDSAQLSWYALAAASEVAQSAEVVVVQIDASDDWSSATWRVRRRHLDALDLAVESERIQAIGVAVKAAKAIVARGGIPDVAEGEHCTYCPCWSSCPAKVNALVQVGRLSGVTLSDPETFIQTAEDAGKAHELLAVVEKFLESGKKRVREFAMRGPLPLSDGRELVAQEVTTTRKKMVPDPSGETTTSTHWRLTPKKRKGLRPWKPSPSPATSVKTQS